MNLLSADLENAVNRTVKLRFQVVIFDGLEKSLGEKFVFQTISVVSNDFQNDFS